MRQNDRKCILAMPSLTFALRGESLLVGGGIFVRRDQIAVGSHQKGLCLRLGNELSFFGRGSAPDRGGRGIRHGRNFKIRAPLNLPCTSGNGGIAAELRCTRRLYTEYSFVFAPVLWQDCSPPNILGIFRGAHNRKKGAMGDDLFRQRCHFTVPSKGGIPGIGGDAPLGESGQRRT